MMDNFVAIATTITEGFYIKYQIYMKEIYNLSILRKNSLT